VNIAVYFIRVRSNLILSCSSEGLYLPIYLLFSGRRRRAGYRGKRKRGEELLEL